MIKLTRHGIAGQFYFTDEKGNESETFYLATDYQYGFTIVHKTRDSKSQSRDLLGRLSDAPTSSGICFYNFCFLDSSNSKVNGNNQIWFQVLFNFCDRCFG